MIQLSDLTKDQLLYFTTNIYNGVGSREFFINPHDLIFSPAAMEHDFAYWRGGPDNLRKIADKEFLQHCLVLSKQHTGIRRVFYTNTSYVYYTFLVLLGKYAWEYYDAPANTWEEFLEHFNKYQASKQKQTARSCIKLIHKAQIRLAKNTP